MVDWRAAQAAVDAGQATNYGGAPVLDPSQVDNIAWYFPLAKSPHGVDVSPDGRWIIGSGKLSPTTTVFDIEKIKTAIQNGDFEETIDGIPVLTYNSVREAEIPVGLGPLHTQFDGNGYAYTSLFVESAVAKWKLPPYDAGADMNQYVVDKIPVAYNIGHLVTAEGDSRSPDGNYLVALNKLSKGRHLSVGPSIPESAQLIDITGDRMKLLYDAFTEPEPHYAVMIHADKIDPIEVYRRDDPEWPQNPDAIWAVEDTRVERRGRTVEVWMLAVNQGDRVIIHVTNIEQTRDELHGLAINDYDINIVIDPGETKTVTFTADKSGVFAFYCTNFCSALHQEMQGYLLVR